MDQKLIHCRNELNRIDDHIVYLLNQRMEIAQEVASVKDRLGLPLTDGKREEEIIYRLRSQAKSPLLQEIIDSLFSLLFRCAKGEQRFSQRKECPFGKIGILGLGLMGGSLLKGLKAKNSHLQVMTCRLPNQDDRLAKESGLLDRQFDSLQELVKAVDCLILAVPISAVPSLAHQLSKLAGRFLVLDIAGVKGEIARLFQTLSSKNIEFVATHPMAGSEKEGFQHSQAGLFIDAPWIIASHANNTEQGLKKVAGLVEFLGANPLQMTPAEHDRLAAAASHIPGVVAKSYLDFVLHVCPEAEQIAGPGFRSFTRIARGQSRMRQEIADANQKEIELLLHQWIKTWAFWAKTVEEEA
ncbi:MAG: prephenate dehydrogenase/arogenate dehydrogenase family protein [Waddliaceae bacterium]